MLEDMGKKIRPSFAFAIHSYIQNKDIEMHFKAINGFWNPALSSAITTEDIVKVPHSFISLRQGKK